PPLTRHYTDYAVWQQAWLSGPAGQAALAYWTGPLSPLPEPLVLPLDRKRPPVRSHRGGFRDYRFDAATSQALLSLAAANRATPFMVLI
ncbi:condensation domain-containing protein, partial [Acinetobacter baumannii]